MELATQRAIPLMSLPQRKLDSYWAKRLGFDFEETQWGDQYPVPHPEKKHQKISPITDESSNTEKFENMSNSESVGFNSVIRKRLCESPLCGSFSGNFNGSQTTNHFTRLGNQYLSPHQDSYLCDQQQNWSCDDNIYSARVEKPTSPTSTCSCMSDYEVFIDSEIRKVLEKEKMEKWMRNNNITHCHKDHTSNEENKCDGVSLDGEISGKSHNSTVTISDDEITDMQEVNINIDHNRERLYLNTNIPAIRGGSGLSVISDEV